MEQIGGLRKQPDARQSRSLYDHEQWIEEQAKKADSRIQAKRLAEERLPKQLFLPGLNEVLRAMPNHIARSSLFAPIARGPKKVHKDVTLVSRNDAVIKFSGEQLDEAQADVWMQVMHIASKQPLGTPVVIVRGSFLRSIGRHKGGSEYRWLDCTMQALAFGLLVIEVKGLDGKTKLSVGKSRALHMIEGFDYDDETEVYVLRIDPRWLEMYSNREFALIDWKKRLRFGPRKEMAKALQRLVATSNDPVQRYALDWLKRKLGYTGRMRDFEKALTGAMRELERLDIIAGGRVEISTKGKRQAVWTKI